MAITDPTMLNVLFSIQLKKAHVRCHPHPTYYGVRRSFSSHFCVFPNSFTATGLPVLCPVRNKPQ